MIHANIKGIELAFKTGNGVFSPDRIDRGTLAMLSTAELVPEDVVMDLGCGYGVVGILAAKLVGGRNVVMSDIDEQAIELSKENAALNKVEGIEIVCSNAFENVDRTGFTMILSNPPYHEDFSVPKAFIEKGFNRLVMGGRFYMVTKRRPWYENKLRSIFGGVRVSSIDGYYVFMSIKKSDTYASKSKKK